MESYEPSTSKVGSTKPSKPKYNTNCSVYGCHSRKAVDRSIHFHGFPEKNSGILVKITNASGREEEMDKRQAWEKVLLMGKPVTKFMKVCSKHFKTTDYLAKGVKMKQPKLNRFAVPSENLPKKRKYCENVDDNSSHPLRKRLAARQEIEDPLRVPELCGSEVVKEEIQSNNCSNDFVQRSYHQLSENEKVVVANLSSLHASENTFCVDKQAQVMSEYDRIRRACLKRGEPWEDPDFPATQTSVFYHQTPPFQFTWNRPKDLCPRPGFVQDGPVPFDVSPGKMGDRWLVSCLGVLYLNKGLFYRVVPADQSFTGDQYAGVFRFRLWWCGEWTEVLVDDRLPAVHGRLAFLQPHRGDHFWPGLLEKAYAKLHGSYEALKYGSMLDGLADLTGGITESIPIRADGVGCGRLLHKLLDMTSIITCVVQPSNQVRAHSENLVNGIQIGINYRLCSMERIETFSGEEIQLVRLKNPSENFSEYIGPWCLNSPEWSEVSPLEMERMQKKLQEGEIWMPFAEFAKTFTHLEVAHLDSDTSRDEPSLRNKNTWQMRLYQGNWQKGVSAGGCRNNPDTFHINPQLQLLLSDMEEVVVSLNQHSIMEPKVIGFTSYSLPKGSGETIGKPFFQKNKSLFNSQYTNSRQVSHRCQLEQGGYLIMPTTFEPGQESGFTLRVYSSKPLKLKLLDTTPLLVKPPIVKAPPLLDGKSFSQYEAVFLQLADEHRTVNAFELQELLDACLPNDYIKSCASIEVCRQIVLTFESSNSGRLKFGDFKDLMCSLKFWQTAFKNHTKEKTGILKAERLRDALLDVGFQLSSDVLATLILRYMRKDGTLRFGDFVSAILHLTVSFNIFDAKDPLQNGSIKMNLTEWLKSSLTC